MGNSTLSFRRAKAAPAKVKKPRPDFPLFPHATGRWAKKVLGKLHYFGKCADDPKGVAALKLWNEQKDDLLEGRAPRTKNGAFTVGALCNEFLNFKRAMIETGEVSPRTFADYHRTCDRIVDVLKPRTPVDDLTPSDFLSLRTQISKKRQLVALKNEIGRVRSVFGFGYRQGLYDRPVRMGDAFKPPKADVLRKARNEKGERMFEAAEIRKLLREAGEQLGAMILLAINGGLGNSDLANLKFRNVNLETGWIDYPRPKTGVKRRFPLWPETVEAIRKAIEKRPTPKNPEHADLVFITKYGGAWASNGEVVAVVDEKTSKEKHQAKGLGGSPLSAEFRKLLNQLEMYREGLSFYSIRHTFETIGGDSCDQVATDYIMGHAPASGDMSSVYRERIFDSRLIAVTNHVRDWLFPRPTVGKEAASNG